MVAEGKIDTDRVKVVWTTPGYVDYVWTARKSVSPTFREKFKGAFLKLDGSNETHRSVLALQGAKKFVPASASDFDIIESVGTSTGLLK